MYFKHFPLINYDGIVTRDITRHVRFIDELDSDLYVHLPYTLKDGESPEDLAYHYYGSVKYTPFVLMANKIVDPYLDWLMPRDVFNRYIIKKYAEQSGLAGDQVLYWAMNETTADNIIQFEDSNSDVMTVDSAIEFHVPSHLKGAYFKRKRGLPLFAVPGMRPVRVYEYEERLNEDKRNIRLIDRTLISRIESEFIKKVSK